MKKTPNIKSWWVILLACWVLVPGWVWGASLAFKGEIFDPGPLKPRDSQLKVHAGDPAPDFELVAIDGSRVRLSDFRGRRNVVLSFIPAAWTPVCSDQWPGYNLAEPLFKSHNAVLLGISVDNRATLFAWTRLMGDLWFPVLSDFWPHGAVASKFGVLRSDGMAERALIFIDTRGVISYIYVSDINKRPHLELIAEQLERLSGKK
jgi:peroxiredoxin (alkyl hydroperoxide reductase subunit C)